MRKYIDKIKHRLKKQDHFYTKRNLLGDIFDIGEYTYGIPRVHADDRCHARLKIGKFCSIAPEVEIFLGMNHRVDWATTYPFASPVSEISGLWPEASGVTGLTSSHGDVIVGNDVWIGLGVTILSGVTIGDGAVIGAKAVVAKDVAPYAIAVGNPAKVVKMRFDKETIDKLLSLQWWNWPTKKIKKAIPLLCSDNIDKLLELK